MISNNPLAAKPESENDVARPDDFTTDFDFSFSLKPSLQRQLQD